MYEKQLKWRDEAKQRVCLYILRDLCSDINKQAIAARQSETEDTECTFTPRIYSVPVKKFTGPAKELNDKSGVTHVRRQASARKEKSELKKYLKSNKLLFCLNKFLQGKNTFSASK